MKALDSVHERLLTGVKLAIGELQLPGLPAERVYVRNLPDKNVATFPCIFVTPGTEPETEGDSTFEDEVIVYPVGVYLSDRAPVEDPKQRPLWLGWRRALMRHFRGADQITGASECFDVRVSTRVPFDDTMPTWFLVQSAFTLFCHCAEPWAAKRE